MAAVSTLNALMVNAAGLLPDEVAMVASCIIWCRSGQRMERNRKRGIEEQDYPKVTSRSRRQLDALFVMPHIHLPPSVFNVACTCYYQQALSLIEKPMLQRHRWCRRTAHRCSCQSNFMPHGCEEGAFVRCGVQKVQGGKVR